MTTDQQLAEALKPILEEAKKRDSRITSLGASFDGSDKIFFSYFGEFGNGRSTNGNEHGVQGSLDSIKPYDPKAEKIALIERLKIEIQKLESVTEETAVAV